MSADDTQSTSRQKVGLRRKLGGLSAYGLGALILSVGAVLTVILVFKPQLQTLLSPGESITAEFRENYLHQMFPDQTSVKVAGLEVGKVSDVEYTDRGTTLVTVKVNNGVRDTLGPEPTATIAPRTVLQGLYSVEIVRGGGPGPMPSDAMIPVERTSVPQELDRILESLPRASTMKSLQDTIGQTDEAMVAGAGRELGNVLGSAPGTLRPASTVLAAAQGTRPGQDLPELVTNLEATATVLTREQGQLGSIVDSLARTSRALGQQARPLAESVAMMPETLDRTRDGLADVRVTLEKLTETAPKFRPAAQELAPTLRELNKALLEAKPLLGDLRPLLRDLRPLVKQLRPVVGETTELLDDLRGGTLERLNGPIKELLLNPFVGTGPYEGSGNGPRQRDNKFYEELAFLVTNLGRDSQQIDAQGSLLGFQAGAGPQTPRPGSNFRDFDELVQLIGMMAGGPHP